MNAAEKFKTMLETWKSSNFINVLSLTAKVDVKEINSALSLKKRTFFFYDTLQHINSDTVSKSHYLPLL